MGPFRKQMASFEETEGIYATIDDVKPVDTRPPTIWTSPFWKQISFDESEGIYATIDDVKPADVSPPIIWISPRSSSRRSYRLVVLLGLLNLLLLAGIIGLSILYRDSAHHASAELSAIKAKLTEHLQVKDEQLSSLTVQQNLLDVTLTNMNKELQSRLRGDACVQMYLFD